MREPSSVGDMDFEFDHRAGRAAQPFRDLGGIDVGHGLLVDADDLVAFPNELMRWGFPC